MRHVGSRGGTWRTVKRPLFLLKSGKLRFCRELQPVVAVRFCPVLFELGEVAGSDLKASIDLPYRMVFAMATKDSVLIYDTQVGQDISVYVLPTPIKISQLA